MENAAQVPGKARGKGRPFQAGHDPRRAGNGRKVVTPEMREKQRLAERAADRVVTDVMAELRSMVGPAVDRLRKLVDDPDPGVALRAATDILSRVNGLPVATNIVAQLNGPETIRRLTSEDVAAAAKAFLLKQQQTIEMSP